MYGVVHCITYNVQTRSNKYFFFRNGHDAINLLIAIKYLSPFCVVRSFLLMHCRIVWHPSRFHLKRNLILCFFLQSYMCRPCVQGVYVHGRIFDECSFNFMNVIIFMIIVKQIVVILVNCLLWLILWKERDIQRAQYYASIF